MPVTPAGHHRHRPPTFYTLRIAVFVAIDMARGIRYFPTTRDEGALPKGLDILTGGISIHVLGALWIVAALTLAAGTYRPSWERRAWIGSILLWMYWGVGYTWASVGYGADEWLTAVTYLGIGVLQVTFLPSKHDRRRPL